MSSLKQIEANRRNALKSTGPTTPDGKRRSRCNAVRHGLTAETVIAALEDSDDYEAFEAAVISDYDAKSAVERELVLRLASVLWRLRRATGIETGLFESVTEDPHNREQHRLSHENLGQLANLAERSRLFLGRQTNPPSRRKMNSVPIQKRVSRTASCASQICRLSPSIVSAATNTRCGGKRDRLCLRWSRCGAASDSRAVQPFHSRFGDVIPALCSNSSGDSVLLRRGHHRQLHSSSAMRWPGAKISILIRLRGLRDFENLRLRILSHNLVRMP